MVWTLSAFADEAGESVEEQVEALQQARINRVDLRNVDGYNITALPVDRAERIRKRLDGAGIQVAVFGSPIGKIDIADDFKIDLERITQLGKIRGVLGCRAVRVFSYYNRQGAPLEVWRSEVLNRLGQLRDRARELGLVLYHENEKDIFGDACARVLDLAEALRDGTSFRLIFDFDNYNGCGEDVAANWRQLAKLTDAFHLKDSDAGLQHVPVGQGSTSLESILADALAAGWEGPLSLEPHLNHSDAVMKTGPHGQANQAYADLSPAECFQVAARAAHDVLGRIGAPVV